MKGLCKLDREITCVVFFIPARGGSKGIPRKNLALIEGESLIEIAVKKALGLRHNVGLRSRVVVSTDDPEIAAEAHRTGVDEVHIRPPEISDDKSTLEQAVSHYIHEESASSLEAREVFVVTQCTSPFMRGETLLRGIELVSNGECDSAFTSVENHFWLYRNVSAQSGWEPVGHSLRSRPPRQQISAGAHETGGAYFFSKSGFLEHGFRLHGKVGSLPIDHLEAIDIDEPSDLEMARLVARGAVPTAR